MNGSPTVIATLVAGVAGESMLNLQYRLDARILRFVGVKKLAKKVNTFGDGCSDYRQMMTDRIKLLGGDAGYSLSGAISEQESVTALFQKELAMEMALINPYEAAVATATKEADDTSRNLFEHILKWHQKQVRWIEEQLRLIALGESDYILENS
jgi:bacterioferritin (cytochrome b1)